MKKKQLVFLIIFITLVSALIESNAATYSSEVKVVLAMYKTFLTIESVIFLVRMFVFAILYVGSKDEKKLTRTETGLINFIVTIISLCHDVHWQSEYITNIYNVVRNDISFAYCTMFNNRICYIKN